MPISFRAAEDGFSGGVGSLRLTRDAGGRVTGFLLTSGRGRHIQFDRVRSRAN